MTLGRGQGTLGEIGPSPLKCRLPAFWKQMVRTESIPLTLRSEEPNEESLGAIRETEEIFASHRPGEGFKTARELLDAARK